MSERDLGRETTKRTAAQHSPQRALSGVSSAEAASTPEHGERRIWWRVSIVSDIVFLTQCRATYFEAASWEEYRANHRYARGGDLPFRRQWLFEEREHESGAWHAVGRSEPGASLEVCGCVFDTKAEAMAYALREIRQMLLRIRGRERRLSELEARLTDAVELHEVTGQPSLGSASETTPQPITTPITPAPNPKEAAE